jgi:hypothetical protein
MTCGYSDQHTMLDAYGAELAKSDAWYRWTATTSFPTGAPTAYLKIWVSAEPGERSAAAYFALAEAQADRWERYARQARRREVAYGHL